MAANDLKEYLDRKRAERQAEAESPEPLLNRMASALEVIEKHTAELRKPRDTVVRTAGDPRPVDAALQKEALNLQEQAALALAEISVQTDELQDGVDKRFKEVVQVLRSMTQTLDKSIRSLKVKQKVDIRSHRATEQKMASRASQAHALTAQRRGRTGNGNLIEDAYDLLDDGPDFRGRDRRGRTGRGGRGYNRSGLGTPRAKGWRGVLSKGAGYLEGLFGGGGAAAEGVGGGLRSTVGGAWKAAKGLPTGVKIGGALTALLAGKELYDVATSDSQDKSKDVAKIAGGAAGGWAGASAGAAGGAALGALGGPAAPLTIPAGAAIGGIAGGIAGSGLGSYAADKVVDGGRWAGDKLDSTAVGHGLMSTVMVGMNAVEAIWNKDARDTLGRTFKEDVIPGFTGITSSLMDTVTHFGTSVADFATSAWKFTTGAVGGAASYVAGQGRSLGSSVSRGYDAATTAAGRMFASVTGGMKSVQGAPKALGALDVKAMKQGSYNDALAMREGGGRSDVVNSYGYMGKYQMGKAALSDLGYVDKRTGQWTGKNGATSQAAFLANPKLQDQANTDFAKQNWSRLNADALYNDKNGKPVYAKDLVGKQIGGQTISESGLLGAAHLGGAGSVRSYLRSDGKDVAVDANGVPITNYMTTMGGKDVSNITGQKSYQGKISSAQFKGNENFYIPSGNGKQYVQFGNAAGNNAINAKVAGVQGLPAGAIAQAPGLKPDEPKNVAQYGSTLQPVTPVTHAVAAKPAKVHHRHVAGPDRVPSGTKPETKAVTVANAGDLRADGKKKAESVPRQAVAQLNTAPTLDSVPAVLDDPSLMQLNMGLI